MLSCSRLNYHYGSAHRVRDVSFFVHDGEILALFGHNGSGKTTILNMMSGMAPVQSGEIVQNGHKVLNEKGFLKGHMRASLGIIFQGTSSDEKLTVRDNFRYAASLMGLSKRNALNAIDAILETARLVDRADDKVKNLSGGLRRRMELYRMFLHEPTLLILDEPTAGLDVKEAQRFFSFLSHYMEQKRACAVIATHSPEEALLCDRVIMLKDGQKILEGNPKDLVGSVPYLRLSVAYERKPPEEELAHVPWFDVVIDEEKACIEAKVYQEKMVDILQGPLLNAPWLKSFSQKNPTLADVYEGVSEL